MTHKVYWVGGGCNQYKGDKPRLLRHPNYPLPLPLQSFLLISFFSKIREKNGFELNVLQIIFGSEQETMTSAPSL